MVKIKMILMIVYQVIKSVLRISIVMKIANVFQDVFGSISLSLSPNPAFPETQVKASASGLSNCNNKIIYVKEGDCSGKNSLFLHLWPT